MVVLNTTLDNERVVTVAIVLSLTLSKPMAMWPVIVTIVWSLSMYVDSEIYSKSRVSKVAFSEKYYVTFLSQNI